MGIMYAYECDLCGDIQAKRTPHEIKGNTYTENGVTKFSCGSCQGKLKAALALGKGGLDDPLKHVGRLLEQKEEEIRKIGMIAEAKTGGLTGVADELRKKREGGGFIPVAGLDFESQYKQARRLSNSVDAPRHSLPAPKPKKKKK